MTWDFVFFFNSILLGIGLAMDAFSVSIANGLNEPHMTKKKTVCIAGTFAFFQALMPMIGWLCVHTILQYFKSFETFIPWIALILLLSIGVNMVREGVERKTKGEEYEVSRLTVGGLFVQGVATSIDALSVGFTISDYGPLMAFVCALIIAAVTIVICLVGLLAGRNFGEKLGDKANILGGVILIAIGIEIFVTGIR